MSDKLLCPFCQQKLVRHWGMKEPALYCCDNPKCSRAGVATESSWQELIRTRKALDVAVDALKSVRKCLCEMPDPSGATILRMACESATIVKKALEQIIALEQKDT